ncbi:MAG: curli production assembly/transport component CsgG [Candidatus Cloacimonetes bacterium]|nr:curli production assembly/transport component CsgG [Candidatus Cloacimonadota bacterium]
MMGACARIQKEEPQATLAIAPENAIKLEDASITLKRKVAIGRFTNESRLANSFLNEGSGTKERMSRAATDILSAKLASTKRFLLIERVDDVSISNEQQISNIESYKIPADYLILGSISEFGRKTSGDVGLIDRTKKQTATAKVTLRIVDTRTGMIIFGEEGSGEASSEVGTVLGMGSTAGYDDTLTDKAIDAAISSVLQNLINKLANDPWRSYVLSAEGSEVIISGGAMQGIKSGDIYKVYRRGKKVLNPQTNIPIELPGKQIATIRIDETIPGNELTEVSRAQVMSGNIGNVDPTELYISDR